VSGPSGPASPHIRRQPTGPVPSSDDARTHLIRRSPLKHQPTEQPTTLITPPPSQNPSGRTAIAAAAVAILSGWPTAVLATDLVSGWWDTDRLFCLAVGFLALVFAGSTVCGVILLLLRRRAGRYLVAFGAGLALVTLGSLFVSGARVAWPVYLIPVLPTAALVLTLHPATGRWCGGGSG
jgi:hypothetical protein